MNSEGICHNNYISGSSTLLRAQETAYRMNKILSKPIAIMPFVTEKGIAKDVTPNYAINR